jgi:DNA gyrase subunit A
MSEIKDGGPGGLGPDVRPIAIEDELKTAYLDYAMSVIVARALPDVRDGLKPVHRRILFSCSENGYRHDKPYRKSARIVGDVIGKYHPHGDAPIYDALVRMAQDFSMRMMLIDGQGNFGSMDGDPPAAMRYTEARLAKISDSLLADLDKDTVNFVPNYDGSEEEPVVLPTRFPNLLVNGGAGIAVGMATNIPPHNLGEVLTACLAIIDNPLLSFEELIQIVPAPDFPTGAQILGRGGAAQAYRTGRGSVVMRGKARFEELSRGGQAIVIDEIPYQVNKASLVEKIAELVKEKRVEGISGVFDESNREGVRVVVELKRDANADVILNQLYRFTPLQNNFSVNMLAINGGRPEQMGLRDVLNAFITFREEVITRRTKFELGKARDRAHILIGLVIAVTNLDEVVAMIRGSASPAVAREKLMTRDWPSGDIRPYLELIEDVSDGAAGDTYRLSEIQANAILELRLNRLTQLGRDEIGDELKELATKIEGLLEILRKRDVLYAVMRQELVDVRDAFPSPRRSEIVEGDFGDIEDEDLIPREEMVVTTTMTGYIKRVPLSAYRAQRRGGKGRSGMATKDEDVLTNVFVTSTHTPVLFFSNIGKVYRMKVWKLPEGTPQSKGKAFINLLPLGEGEVISTILPLPEDEDSWKDVHVVFATAHGYVRRNSMEAFTNVPSNGKIAMKFEGEDADDRLIGVALCNEEDDILLAARGGKAIRFSAGDVREMQSRASVGVRGMTLPKGDEVISLTVLKGQDATTEERDLYLKSAAWKLEPAPRDELSDERFAVLEAGEQFLLTVTSNGYGKRTSSYEYRTMGRGNQGVTNIETSARNGEVVASFPVAPTDEVIIVSDQGQLIRIPVKDIRIAGRNTQGVTLFKVADDEHVVSVAHIADDGEGGDEAEGEDSPESSDDSAL